GHVQNTKKIGGAVFRLQNQLLDQNEAGFIKYGWDWFQQEDYKLIVTRLGCAPFKVGRQREIDAEAFAIPVIVNYYRGKPPATVRQAIQKYHEAYPLSFAVADTQRRFASDLDARLPKTSFPERVWKRVR